MYQFFKYKNTKTREEVLQVYNESEIFSLVFGFYPKPFDKCCSPFRIDNKPNCYFNICPFSKNLLFIDFAAIGTINNIKLSHLNCFDAVRLYFNLPEEEVNDFILSKEIKHHEYNRNLYQKEEKQDVNLYFYPKPFSLRDRDFWMKYGISKENLIDDKVFSVQSYSIVREDSFRHYIPDNICYAYTDFPDNKKKIYSPYDKKLKFCGNITAKDIGNINNIPVKGEKLIITKSYKDCRVLRNLGYTSIWNQNEGMIPPLYLLQDLSDRFNDIIIFYDNDNAGINAGIKLKQTFANIQKEVSVYYIPLTYKVKDISDFYARYGLEQSKNLLKQNKNL